MNRLVKVAIINVLFFSQSMLSFVGPVTPGQSLWDISRRIGETDDIIESKVCLQDSQLDVVESKIDAIDCTTDASFLELIESKVCEIDSQLDIVESKIDAIDCTTDASLLRLIESKVCEIDSQLDIIESKIDAIDDNNSESLLELIESKVCEIDSQLDTVESKIDVILIDSSLLELIESKVCEIDSQLDIIESKIDAIDVSSSESLLELIESKVCEIDSQLDIIESKIDVSVAIEQLIESKVCEIDSQLDIVESKIDLLITLTACDPMLVLSAGTITESGSYCLANAITGTITIAASDVVLDLNNYTVSDGITVNGGLDWITIKNGSVSGSLDAILVNGGSTNITISNVIAKNAERGINFNNVTRGFISSCEMTLNTTGLELDHCHKIVVRDCTASCNTHAGFDLISSTTNCFESCKALSTGEGNNELIENNVFGFVSADGYGNIFERCIANSTQALTTTDFNSIIAGFALRGSEGCTKIIGCESANSMASEQGDTKPYGIFLEPALENLLTFTQLDSVRTNGAAWSPSGKYLALSDQSSSFNQRVYSFDSNRNPQLELLQGFASEPGLAWSPDEQYIVFGASLYSFTPDQNPALTQIATGLGAEIAAAWHPDGRFIASADELNFRLHEFRPETVDGIELIQTTTISGFDGAWSPDGEYLLTAGRLITLDGNGILFVIYRFTPSDTPPLTPIILETTLDPAGQGVAVSWSPDGCYIIASELDVGFPIINGRTSLYRFDRDALTVTLLDLSNSFFAKPRGITWSPDGKRIAMVTPSESTVSSPLLAFNPSPPFLTIQDTGISSDVTSPSFAGGAVSWYPDGSYLVEGNDTDTVLYNTAHFPEKNVIKDNVVYCNSNHSANSPQGVGISGSNIANMIMSNQSYNNPLSYEVMTNLFNGLSNGIPSLLQNIGILGCVPPAITTDIAQEILIMKAKVCDMQSKIDAILLAV